MLKTLSASSLASKARKASIRDEPAERVRQVEARAHHLHAGERKRHVPAAETPQKMKIRDWTKHG